jgi:hypothetical protein
MSDAVKVLVTRYQCPHCTRSRSRKSATVEHIARCWHNPAARSCKTCDHYDQGSNGCIDDYYCNCASGEKCWAGVDLSDGQLRIHCPKWSPADDIEAIDV